MMLRTLGGLALEGTPLRRPKPLLLLAYLALEGPTSRRFLAELFFGDVDDPRDSLSTTLKRLKDHTQEGLVPGPQVIATTLPCDAALLLRHLDEGRVEEASNLYRGPFLHHLSLKLSDELEEWLYSKQDMLAQRLRTALIEQAEEIAQADKVQGARLAERAWRQTGEQGIEVETFARLYALLLGGSSPYALEIRRQASSYGIPLLLPLRKPEAEAEPSPADQGEPRPLRPFVQNLLASLESLSQGEAGLALGVWGPSGIGKTFAVQQVLRALSYPSVTLSATIAPGKIAQRLPRSSDLPSWARATLSRLTQGQAANLQDTVDALAALLAALAPIVLHVEDLHEAEGEALELWESLAKAVKRSHGVAIVVTSRQEPPPIFTAQQFPPLIFEETWRLLKDEAGSGLPTDAATYIHEHAAGNPLFTLEFFRFLRRQGNLWRDGRRWRWRAPEALRIPANVEVLIVQALHRAELSEEANALMRLKALLPIGTSDEVLAQVLGVFEAELSSLSVHLEAAGILREGMFVHPLYRELLKRELPQGERRRLAKQVVEALATTKPELAAPFVADAGLRSDEALDLFERAAERVHRHGREKQAGEFLASAASYATGHQKRDLLLRAANLLHILNSAQAQRLLERVLEAEPHHVEASLLLARLLVRHGEGEQAEAVLQALPQELRPTQRWFDEYVSLRAERNDYQGAVELWQSRPELQEPASVITKRDAAYSLMNLGAIAEADGLLENTLQDPSVTEAERASLLEVCASIAFYTGKYQASLDLLDEVIALLRGLSNGGVAQQLMYALRFRTMVYWGLCRLREAVQDTEEAMRLASDLGSGRDYAINQAYLGVSLTELGDYERAEDELFGARGVLERSNAREHLAACEAMLSGLYTFWQPEGAAVQALRYANRSLNVTRELGAPMLICQATSYTSYAESAFGSAERALALAQETLDIGMQFGQRRVVGTGYWVRGRALERLGKVEDALRDFDEGEHILEEMGLPGLATYVGLDAARLRDDRESARKHVQRLRELGVVGYTLPARRHFASLFEDWAAL